MSQLGEYLVQEGAITSDQLVRALEYQRNTTRNLSLMALTEGILTRDEMQRALARQIESGESFEEALRGIGFFSPERLSELYEMRKEFRIPLGEILRRQGALDERKLRHWIEKFERLFDERENELRSLLGEIDLFSSLDADILDELARIAKLKHHEPGDIIYREGQACDAIYIIESGLVRLSSGEAENLLELGQPRSRDHFGRL